MNNQEIKCKNCKDAWNHTGKNFKVKYPEFFEDMLLWYKESGTKCSKCNGETEPCIICTVIKNYLCIPCSNNDIRENKASQDI